MEFEQDEQLDKLVKYSTLFIIAGVAMVILGGLCWFG